MAENTFEASPSTNGGNKKLFLIIGIVLVLGVVAAAVFGFVLASRMGWIGVGTDMIVGFPDSDGNYDLYLLEMGQSEDEGVRLAKDAQIGDYAIYVFQEQDYSKMIRGAGFVPDSSYVFLAYQDDDDAVFEQMTIRGDEPDDLFETDDYPVLIAFPDQKNVVIIEYTDDEARCFLAPFGQEADRLAKGTDCIFLPDGETLVVVEEDNGEYSFTALDMDSGDENKFLEVDAMLDMYQVSFDGSLMAYVEDSGGEQELHLININNEEEDKVAEGSRISDFGFAPKSNDFYFVVEDDEGDLSLYVNEENDAVAEGLMVAAQFGPQGEYLIFAAGDELDDLVVSSYSLKDEEAEEIADGEGLEFAVVSDPTQVIVTESTNDGDLTVYSSSIDGTDVVEVLDEKDVFSWDIWSVPDHEFLYFVLYTADDTFGFASPFGGGGFFFVEEWVNVTLLNVSPNGKYLAFVGIEDAGDDPILFSLELKEGSDPEELDDDAEWFVNAVFTKNSRELLYTVETGLDADEVSVNRVDLDDGSPETLYDEATLIDVEWGELYPFDYLNFAYMSAGESYCPGAISLSADSPVDAFIGEFETLCFRFSVGGGEVWNLDIDSFSEDLDLDATLLDSDGFYMSYNDDGLYDLDPWLAYRFDQSGVYFLEVTDIDGAAGDFMVTLLESEDSFATAQPYFLGESFQGTITEGSLVYMESPEFDLLAASLAKCSRLKWTGMSR
jgi:Tol biopolymer transport system component